MTALSASVVPLAVRVKNARYDGMVTGYIHGAPTFVKTDPGGYRSGSFVVDQRLGFRSDMIQPYSRIFFYNKRNGDTLFEGDVTHPGRSVSDNGALLEVQVEGGAERLNDWSGPRIYVDRDMQAWTKLASTSVVSATVDAGEDRGGSGLDALNLAFPMGTHVETNHRVNAIYTRILEASQTVGRIDYTWDAGLTNVDWLVRMIVTPPNTVVRTQTLSTGGGLSGPVTAGVGVFPTGSNSVIAELKWIGSPSSTGTVSDTSWVSLRGLVVVVEMVMKDGTARPTGTYDNLVTAPMVWEDLLGGILAASFDGPSARIDVGAARNIWQLAFPDGITPMGIADELMKFEPCTYIVGPSKPGSDKYSLTWLERSTQVRYEFNTWVDDYTAGAQPAEQYNEASSRWKTPGGGIRFTTTTQSIPEMAAVGRTRRYFQDLGVVSGDADNATTANASALEEHRYPRNGGRVRVQREVVDLFTGRRVQPFEIEPSYLCRIVGVDPSVDALNATKSNGSSVCRIVTTGYSAADHAVDLDLDSVPWSVFRAIANTTRKNTATR